MRWILPLLLTALPARADDDLNSIEHLLGATAINGAVGNGATTAGISAQGELTVLRWPSPSYFEHMSFQTSNAVDARMQPHFGARDNMGSFAGVFVAPGPNGAQNAFAWARDAGWTVDQRYVSDDSNQLVTALHNADLRLTVTYTDAVSPSSETLVRRIAVAPDAGFVPSELTLFYFENLSPTLEKADFYPVDQTNLLDQRDYALAMSGKRGALVHFSLPGRDPAKVAALAAAKTPADVDAFLDGLSDQGMFWVIGSDRPPDGFQCGYELSPAPMGAPQDAYLDATDGALSNSPAALAHADGALAWKLPPAGGTVDVLFTPGTTLAAIQPGTGDAILAGEIAFAKGWLAPATLPATDDVDRLRMAKRALLSIAVGRDHDSGAIVASISSQPPYNLDWPRDGAFIDYALDVAGQHDWVTQHRKFYATVQRKNDGDDAASGKDAFAGSFAMNYYADGHPGGPVPLEIDEVGLALWEWYEHAKWIDEPARTDYLNAIYPSLALAADLLTTCVDPATKLQCLENEDDHFDASISLHGAITTWLGLASSVRAANYLGHGKADDARRWRARLDEIASAIERAFGDPMLGYRGQQTALPGGGASGAVAWTLWPAQFHPFTDGKMVLAAAQIETDYAPFFSQSNAGGSYYGKGLIGLALLHGENHDAAGTARTRDWLDLLVKQVPTRTTGHYGETFLYDGNGAYTDVVSIPHLWEATLTYLALVASYSPEKFSKPDIATLDVPPGCGCTVGARPKGAWPTAALALLLIVLTCRVDRSGRPATSSCRSRSGARRARCSTPRARASGWPGARASARRR